MKLSNLTIIRLQILGLLAAVHCPCEEQDAPPAPEATAAPEMPGSDIQFFDASGRPMEAAPNAGSFQLLTGAPMAVTSLATAQHAQLTTYAVGLAQTPLDALVDFMFPPVEVPLLFEYVQRDANSEFASVEDDQIGANGRPQMVVMDADSVVQAKLMYRGLGTPYGAFDMQVDQGMPGSSLDRGRQKRVRFMRMMVHNARAKRAVAAFASAAGAATGVSIATTEDPIKKVRPYITPVAEEMGTLDQVRIAIGATAYNNLLDHPFLCGGGSGNSRRTVTHEELARLFEVRPENLQVVRYKALSTTQGNTKTKSYVLGEDQLYVFGAMDQPTEYDNSFGKSFYMGLNGQRFDVVVDEKGIHGEEVYLRYFENLKATNTAAIDRLALTFT